MGQRLPDIGNWFENIEDGALFEIVAIDEFAHTVEVQYLDGTLDEFEMSQWHSLPIVDAAPPEDANIAYGMTAVEQSPDSNGNTAIGRGNPLDNLEGENFAGTDESPF
ncbi:DUF6763 family protein [Microbulbifer hainanensis]|uniref:DUF6763 family protein n=1 Tax=Microbulbifer hainanensis TaxID=2735675 RepID=UPI001867DABD|nr:DUF6763 family protein [Microbulbifer hainanensis]